MEKPIQKILRSLRGNWIIFACMYLFFFMVACSDKTNHEVLTFFFTGIPNGQEQQLVAVTGDDGISSVDRQGSTDFLQSSHNFYTSKNCEECHYAFSIRTFGEIQPFKELEDVARESKDFNREQPVHIKSCESCHEKLSAPYAIKHNLWRHAPISKGNCTVCHVPHQSKYPKLLKDTSDQLCVMCHSEGNITRSKSHKNLKSCMTCHNPHLGRDKNLLLIDYQERVSQEKEIIASKNPQVLRFSLQGP